MKAGGAPQGGGPGWGAGQATGGRQSPIVLSTAHRFIQEPRAKRTAGSRVDSALNSFKIAGGATEATGRGLQQPGGRGRAYLGSGVGWGRLITLIPIKRNQRSFQNPSKIQTATRRLGRDE